MVNVPQTDPGARVPEAQRGVIGIDLLRLLAAGSVIVFHLGFKAFSNPGSEVLQFTGMSPSLPGSWAWTWWGWVGVQVFFVISGLVIAFSASSSKATPGRFIHRRVMRLIPAVLIAALVALAVEILIFDTPVASALVRWVKTILFYPLPPWIMGQFWTLGIEISFYALVLIPIVLKRPDLLRRIGFALILLCGLYWTLRYMGGGRDPIGRITQLLVLQHGAYFGIGILMSQAARHGWTRSLAAGVALGCVIAAEQVRRAAGWEGGQAGLAHLWPVAYAVFLGTVGLAIAALHWNDRILAVASNWTGAVRMAGLMTYPLYLLHNHTGKPVMIFTLNLGMPPVVAVVLAIGVTLLLSWWVAATLEPNLRDRLERLSRRIWPNVD